MSTAQVSETTGVPRGVKVMPSDPLYGEVLDFLYTEVALLDENRLTEWLEMLGDDLSYRMPIRITTERGQGSGFSESTYFDDDKMLLGMRVMRVMTSQNAHAEMPATRSRRYVTNVRVESLGDDVIARSSVLLLVSRWDNKFFEFLGVRRNDVLRRVEDELKLASREILIDQAVVDSPNLSVFL